MGANQTKPLTGVLSPKEQAIITKYDPDNGQHLLKSSNMIINHNDGTHEYIDKLGKWTYNIINGKIMNGIYVGQSQTIVNRDETYNGDILFSHDENGHECLKYHGQGIIIYNNGDQYIGQFNHDLKHGYGKYIYNNGDYYNGQWENNLAHGRGIFFKINDICYCGQWCHDLMHGQFICIYHDGNHSVGYFLYNCFQKWYDDNDIDIDISLYNVYRLYTIGSAQYNWKDCNNRQIYLDHLYDYISYIYI